MKIPFSLKEYKALFKLGLPITISQLGMTLQGLADTIMVGQHSGHELAAAGFVNSLFIIGILLSVGFSNGAVARMGYLYGQGRTRDTVAVVRSNVWANLFQTFIITTVMTVIYFLLPHLGQDPSLLPLMQSYYAILLPSLPLLALAGIFKPFFDSINDTAVPMWIMLIGNVWNVIGNWVLIFGHCGLPEMGIEGAAWATASSRALILLLYIAVFCFSRRYRPYRAYWSEVKATRREFMLLNKLGWPVGIQMCIETLSFAGASLWLGWGGESWDAVSSLAAYQVMSQISALIFMFFIGIGAAISIRVSNYHGQHDQAGIRMAAHCGYEMILVISIVLSVVIFSFRQDLAQIFVSAGDPALLEKVSGIVVACCVPLVLYQFGDGMQSAYVNALRGLGDVKPLMLYSFIAYIVISLPMSYLFGIVMDGGCPGIWYGFPFGLTTAAFLYLHRFLKDLRS